MKHGFVNSPPRAEAAFTQPMGPIVMLLRVCSSKYIQIKLVSCSQEVNPDPIALADFEDIFQSVGGVRTWSGERLTSPLVLSDTYDRNYSHWCRNKSRCDPNNLLQSCYIQGYILVEFST